MKSINLKFATVLILTLFVTSTDALAGAYGAAWHSGQGQGYTITVNVEAGQAVVDSVLQDPTYPISQCMPSLPKALAPAGWSASMKAGGIVYVTGPPSADRITYSFDVPHLNDSCMKWQVRVRRASDKTELPMMQYSPSARKGLTYGFKEGFPPPAAHPKSYASLVGCRQPGKYCNAIDGDTHCVKQLPLLCIAETPNQPIPNIPKLKDHWAGGRLATTKTPRMGLYFRTRAEADAECKAEFNNKWRVAEWHDNPRGNNLAGFGHPDENTRYWVHIRDQNSTCWLK